jgi:hypothetical protein
MSLDPSFDINYYKDLVEGPVLLLGNGPSIKTINPSSLSVPTIGIHRSWHLMPSNFHVILRSHPRYDYWTNHWEEFTKLKHQPDVVFTSDVRPPEVELNKTKLVVIPGVPNKQVKFSLDLSKGSGYFHAGTLALEVAVWLGYNPIYLIGYDLNNDEGNFMAVENVVSRESRSIQRSLMIDAAKKLQDVKVYNCSWISSLQCFEKHDLEALY